MVPHGDRRAHRCASGSARRGRARAPRSARNRWSPPDRHRARRAEIYRVGPLVPRESRSTPRGAVGPQVFEAMRATGREPMSLVVLAARDGVVEDLRGLRGAARCARRSHGGPFGVRSTNRRRRARRTRRVRQSRLPNWSRIAATRGRLVVAPASRMPSRTRMSHLVAGIVDEPLGRGTRGDSSAARSAPPTSGRARTAVAPAAHRGAGPPLPATRSCTSRSRSTPDE